MQPAQLGANEGCTYQSNGFISSKYTGSMRSSSQFGSTAMSGSSSSCVGKEEAGGSLHGALSAHARTRAPWRSTWQLWQSLPNSTRALALLVVLEAAAWVVGTTLSAAEVSGTPCTAEDCCHHADARHHAALIIQEHAFHHVLVSCTCRYA
jgi:hypothetical protein